MSLLYCLQTLTTQKRDPPSMAGTGGANAFIEKLKPDLPNSINVTPDEKIEVEEDNSISIQEQKLEIPTENDKNDTLSFSVDDKLTESKKSINICASEKDEGGGDGKEDNKVDADDSKVEAEIFDWKGKRFTAIEKGKGILIEESDEDSCFDEKGKGILIEESDEESDEDFCFDDSSDDFDSDFSDEPEWDVEDDLFPRVD